MSPSLTFLQFTHRGIEVWQVGKARTSCCKAKYSRTKWVISSRLGMGGRIRSEIEWSSRQTNLRELQGDLCDLSKPKFTSLSKSSMNILNWRKLSASKMWPAWKMNKCVERSQMANQLSILSRCNICLL